MSSVNSGASLPNSQSINSNMEPASPPPHRPKPSKMLSIQVHFLDDTVTVFHVQQKACGRVLFEQVCKTLNLLEVDYFGLEYSDSGGTKYWLDYEKPLCRQMGLSMVDPIMYFCVKFYTPDPAQLEEEYTRYIYSLQIKRDLAQGILQCNDNTAALMASYIVQAECGDYEAEDYPDHTYLSSFKFVPHQDAEFERKIMENHKKHVGQSPAEADLNLLETARRCELYGIRMTPAKDHEGVPLNLATAHMGVLVFQNYTKINTFSWAKIRKLSFKRKKFLIKLHPEGYGYYQDTVEFLFEGRNECKNFWKKCIEHHGFFRCAEVRPLPRQKARIFSRGSSFRYSGRTQKQIVEYVRENYIKRQPFQRSTSLRISSTTRNSLGKVGTSISAQPLLPVCDTSTPLTPNQEAAPGASSSPPFEDMQQQQRPASVSPAHAEERLSLANGTICANGRRTPPDHHPGLETPDLGQDSEGLRSPDFLGNDTDDNISHDSYHLDEERCNLQGSSGDHDIDNINYKSPDDEVSEPKAPQVFLDDANDEADGDTVFLESKIIPEKEMISEEREGHDDVVTEQQTTTTTTTADVGEIPYVLHRQHLSAPAHSDAAEGDQNAIPMLHTMTKVNVERIALGHVSPLLYARANRLSSTSSHDGSSSGILPKSPRASRTVDVVSFRHLPSAGSFSSQDDSLDDEGRNLFEQLRKKHVERAADNEARLPPPPEWTENKQNIVDNTLPQSESSLKVDEELNYISKPRSEVIINNLKGTADRPDTIGDLNRNVCDKSESLKIRAPSVLKRDVAEPSLDIGGNRPFVPCRPPPVHHHVSFSSVDDHKELYSLKAVPPTNIIKEENGFETNNAEIMEQQETDMLDQDLGEVESSDEEDVAISVSSSSSREMHRLSEAHMHEAHFVLSEEDLTLDEEDTLEESHIESVYLEIAQEEETIQPHSHYNYGSYRFSHANSLDEGSSAEGDCEPELDNSIHEGLGPLEDISEHLEGLSDEETAPITNDTAASKGLPTESQEESLYRSFIELEVSGGHVVGTTTSSQNAYFS